ncbi:SGNH/GDSL hydrolase family protein [Amnibacterium flavum]|uniref:SGNH/GDSL hydrolase family protein n=1 Tax=Amnibacterium flavum TaxID=2173173 RepID=UPI001F0C7AC6|nr:SGNH/GDSL hydrolase family protein [Amnibacterium flavum]
MPGDPDGVRRFVAIGDSFTEGVGDPHRHLPNGVRGWADRVAERLAKNEPGWEYANLAVRSKRLREIVADQVDLAIELRPTLVTVYAGGNDILDVGTDIGALLDQYEAMVVRLVRSGATVLLFTGYEVQVHPILAPFKRRNRVYNEGVRRIAREHGAVLVDYQRFEAFADRRMWAEDRLHMSKAGHRYLASRVLEILDVPHRVRPAPAEPRVRRTLREREREHRRWILDWVLPLVQRKLRGVTLGDDLSPRWPEPVRVPVKGGLRRLAKERRLGSG